MKNLDQMAIPETTSFWQDGFPDEPTMNQWNPGDNQTLLQQPFVLILSMAERGIERDSSVVNYLHIITNHAAAFRTASERWVTFNYGKSSLKVIVDRLLKLQQSNVEQNQFYHRRIDVNKS